MPNLPTHIYFALNAMDDLHVDFLNGHVEAFMLGSTSPDIRALTKKNRSLYHFVELDFESVGDGISNLKSQYPKWKDLSSCSEETKAFMMGYASHLVLDETYITSVFRPYFRDDSIFPVVFERRIWDRAFQLSLDMKYWTDQVKYKSNLLKDYKVEVDVDFLIDEPINEWKDLMFRLISDSVFNWERLISMSKRIARRDNLDEAELLKSVDKFLVNPQKGIDNILSKLPNNLLSDFEEKSNQNIVSIVNRFIK